MKAIFLLLHLLMASTLLAAEPDHIAILLCERTEKALSEPLRTYVADVEQRFPVKLQIVAKDWKTPEEVRAAIKDLFHLLFSGEKKHLRRHRGHVFICAVHDGCSL